MSTLPAAVAADAKRFAAECTVVTCSVCGLIVPREGTDYPTKPRNCTMPASKPIYRIEDWQWFEMFTRQACSTCAFWLKYVDRKYDAAAVRVGHTHYVIGPEPSDQAYKVSNPFGCYGHGGRRFVIQFLHDDRVVTSRNLWCQGDIPEHLWDRLPDNAVFV